MALTPPNDEAFLREVDDELRRDQLTTLWQRYGRLGIGVVVLLLAALGATLWWRAEQARKADAHGEQMSAAIADIQASRKADAQAKLTALAADGGKGYHASALFAKAALAADAGDKKSAIALYASIAADSGTPQPFRDLALIRQTAIEYDMLKPAQVVDRLKPLAVEGEPWFGTAGELTAVTYLDMNRPTEAGRLLAAVAADPKVPQSLRGRAKRLAATLGADVATATAQKD